MSEPVTAADIPWNGTVPHATNPQRSLGDTLQDVQRFIHTYVVLTEDQAITVTLWVAHSHAIDAADCTPYLQITSATKRAGKTRLLEVLEPLVARAWFTGRVTAAALVRKVDATQPTLLLDESDAALGAAADKEYSEALRGLLNSGYRRSGKSTICVGQGANIHVQDFSTFSVKAIAGIGELPATIADRSTPIKLKRRTTGEPCARWRERDGHAEAAPMYTALADWAQRDDVIAGLRSARPALPAGLGDRQCDVWEPLLAIADLAGGNWPAQARAAALALAGHLDDTDITVELLKDIAAVLPTCDGGTVVASKVLIEALVELTERPWATWRHDKPISPRGLARLLDPLDIHVDQFRIAGTNVRGYRRDAFQDAIARYLPLYVGSRDSTNESGPESQIPIWDEAPPVPLAKTPKTPVNIEEIPQSHMDPGNTGKGADFTPPMGISREAWLREHVKPPS